MLLDDIHLDPRVRRRAIRRIALLSAHASPLAAAGSGDCGGQNVYVANLARELAQCGYQVDIFTRRDAIGQQQLVGWRDKVRVIYVPAGPAHFVPKEQILPFMDDFASFVVRFTQRQGSLYDIVHAHSFMSGMVARQIRQELGIPFVITFHALGHIRRLAPGVDGLSPQERLHIDERMHIDERLHIEECLLREADRIIAKCPQDRLDMVQLYGANPARIDIAPCGFDPQQLWPVPLRSARQRLGLAQGRFIMLHLGRIVPRKGVDTVIDSLALLRGQYGIDAELLVVGGEGGPGPRKDTPELARLRALAASLGIAGQVQFAGRKNRDELRYYYSACDAFVTTPWYEPFGITPVEAMACARPVVGADVGGIRGAVVDGETGYLVAPRDPLAVAARLAALHAKPALAQNMGDEGMRSAYQHYTWRTVAQQAGVIYARAAGDGLAPSHFSYPEGGADVRPSL